MKRKQLERPGIYSGEGTDSFYSAPPLESTLLIDTGGVDDRNPIGNTPSTNISAAVSSGTRTFQYNRYFWNRELFSFNYKNNAIGIAIAYFRADLQRYSFAILPIFLPRVAMTLLQSLSENSPTEDPAARKLLLQELIYYLNLGFTTGGTGNNYNTNGLGLTPYHLQIGPWVLASDARGSPLDISGGTQIVNNPDFPIFQDGANAPPLFWDYSGNNSQLCLRVNSGYAFNGDIVGFQVITLEEYFCNSPEVSNTGRFLSSAPFNGSENFWPVQSYNDGNGWCCQGAFATGFGQTKNYTSFENILESVSSYSDIYTSDERRQLFAATRFPVYTPNPISASNFLNDICKKFRLVTNGPNNPGILLSSFITSMIPARFVSISSDSLTRNQKRPLASNNPTLSVGTMAIQCITLDQIKTWSDDTVAGQTSSAGSLLFGSRKSGVDDCAIVSMDPMQSLQVLDLKITDEWGNVIQNYSGNVNDPASSSNTKIFNYWECGGVLPGQFVVAPWASFFNPIPTSPESIFMNESWWCSIYQVYGNNPPANTRGYANTAPLDFAPGMPQSSTVVHFGRVLGF